MSFSDVTVSVDRVLVPCMLDTGPKVSTVIEGLVEEL